MHLDIHYALVLFFKCFLLGLNYFIGASSIGTSINPQFIASFASAAGKRPHQDFDSQESYPEVILNCLLKLTVF
jgi:hypothetical protein